MHRLAANRRVLPLLFAASAFALIGVIPLACVAEESVTGIEQPLVLAAQQSSTGPVIEQPIVAAERPADRSILLAADQPSAPLAQRWPMWTEAPARPVRKAVRMAR